VDVLLRVAPEVRLSSSASGLRATLEGERSRPDTGVGSRLASNRSAPTADEHPTLSELEARARQAQKSDDLPALWSVEETLRSLHLENHPLRRRPETPEAGRLPAKERALLERNAFEAALPRVSVFKRSARSKARAAAETEADTFGRALDLAQVVIAQHRAAVVNDQWSALAGHDRSAVIAELDAEFAAAGCGCTCIDAGWDAESSRGYVTIVTRYPDIDIVAERGPGFSSSGRPMLRRRTRAERNSRYLSGLASFALAAARRAISVAVAADDVHLVVVRRTGDGLEPIYVGSLSREAITLRPALADPVPLLLGSAVRPLQFDGPAHDLVAVTPHDDVTDIVRRCVAALDDGRVETEPGDSEIVDSEIGDSEIVDSEALGGVEHEKADGIRARPEPTD
jgi:hypothetical protein